MGSNAESKNIETFDAAAEVKPGIGYSTWDGKVYAGMQRIEDGYIHWVGDKVEVTEQFVFVLYQFLEDNNFRKITTDFGDGDEMTNIFFNVPRDHQSLEDAIISLIKIKEELDADQV